MYCFSEICRICLKSFKIDSIKLNIFDTNNIKRHEKLLNCVPEIFSTCNNFPENICKKCYDFIKRMHKFKQMYIENTTLLNKYISKLSNNIDLPKQNEITQLRVKINVDKDQWQSSKNSSETSFSGRIATSASHRTSTNKRKSDIRETNSKQQTTEKLTSMKGMSMFNMSLNEWDLFETKYTCRCKENVDTEHSCKNCDGDLLGFRLSKIKLEAAQNRYNKMLSEIQSTNEDSDAISLNMGTENCNSEYGFNYNDTLLCKVHINEVNKQINNLENNINFGINCVQYYNTSNVEHNHETINATFTDIPRLQEKKESKDKKDNIKRHSCTICDKSFSRKYSLNHHFLTHPGSKLNECPKCSRRYINKEEFDMHLLTHLKQSQKNSENILNSNTIESDYDSISDSEQEEHVAKRSPTKYDLNSSDESLICGTCDKICASRGSLAIHLMTHFGKKDYKCTICNKKFFRKENLEEHLHKLHGFERKYKCSSCDKKYNHISNLRRHIRKSHAVDKYLCTVCNKNFTHKIILEQHIFDVHTKSENKIKLTNNENNFTCSVCHKTFNHQNNLRMHSLTHSEPANESKNTNYCNLCQKSYSKKTNMKKHMLTHSRGNIYDCNICYMKFDNRWVLRQHVKTIHAGESSLFKCRYCDKIYSAKWSLTKHSFKQHSKL